MPSHIDSCRGAIGVYLAPTDSRIEIEYPDISVSQNLERCIYSLLIIELRGTYLPEIFKPRGIYEVGHQHAVNLIAVLVGFASVAHLVSVRTQSAVEGRARREIDVWINKHLKQFMAQRDCPR